MKIGNFLSERLAINDRLYNTEKKNKKTLSVLKRQLTRVLEKKFNKNNIIVAYEPIWSIGTGKIPTANELKKTTIHIKKVLKGIFKKNSPAVLYGGSVDGSNVEMFKEIREIDGFLIGGASKTSKKYYIIFFIMVQTVFESVIARSDESKVLTLDPIFKIYFK